MRLFAIHARHITRKSRRDPGQLGIWLVYASSTESALREWGAAITDGMWTMESIKEHAAAVTRVL